MSAKPSAEASTTGTSWLPMAVIPYTLAIFASAVLIVRLYDRLTPRQIGRIGFILVAAGLMLPAFAIYNT